ncbi:MAG: hypothetical protein JWM58_4084 [Rhizobium sp.]|nr:hypothetical protein [Rhizobium sp.]
MAVNFQSSDSATQWVTNTAGDTYVLKEGIHLLVQGTAISGTAAVANRKFQIDGHVFGEGGGSGMFIGQDATNGGSSTVQIGDSGSILGEAYGIVAHGGDLNLLNNGSLSGSTAGLYMSGALNVVLNQGTIVSYDGIGINSQGAYAEIQNFGTISGVTKGVLLGGTNSVLINGGNIIAKTTGDGAIQSEGADIVRNTGLLFGSVQMGDDNDEFHNLNGIVTGAVDLGDGDDKFVSKSATFDGNYYISGGTGSDNFYIDDAGLNIREYTNEGYDTVYASVSYALNENFEDLTLMGSADLSGSGNSGDNYLTGNTGNNRLFGRAGNDSLETGEGKELYNGGAGSDTVLYIDVASGATINLATGKGTGAAADHAFVSIENVEGGDFNDKFIGNAAANHLNGWAGNDALTGGGGKDVFIFVDGNDKDTITDFQDKTDKIRLEIHANGIDLTKFSDLNGLIEQKGNDVVIDFNPVNAGDKLIFKNADVSDFTAADFLFG